MNTLAKSAFAAMLAVGFGVGAALAHDDARGGEAMAEATGAKPADAAAAPMLGKHTMQGEITSIAEDGKVGLKTGVGELLLHFPPASLAGLKKGDTITVNLSFEKP